MDIDKGQGISMDKDFKAEAPQEKDNYIEQSFNTFKSSKHEPLEVFEDLIIECFGLKQQAHTYCEDKLILSHGVSRSGSPFLCIWESLRSRLNEVKITQNVTRNLNWNTCQPFMLLLYLTKVRLMISL